MTNGTLIVGGILLGLLILLVAYASLMLLYFYLRTKWPKAKYGIEFGFILIAVLCSFVIRFVMVAVSENSGFGKSFADFFRVAYATIGGITFEGLDSASEKPLLNALFYGIPLLVGVLSVSIFTAKANYEFYSKIRMYKNLFGNGKIYIFTSVTADSIALANDIKSKEKNSTIIFSGPDIPPFDRKNELCIDVMGGNYLYWSLNGAHEKPLITSLKISRCRRREVYIFSCALAEDFSADESRNIAFTFDDICANCGGAVQKSIEKSQMKMGKGDCSATYPQIRYYILTKTNIDYKFFEDRLNEFCVDRPWLRTVLGIRVVNEAILSARDLMEERAKVLDDRILKDVREDEYNIAVLGFGETGQQAMENLFTNTISVVKHDNGKPFPENYLPNRFCADVFDSNINKYSGVYSYTHPLFAYCNATNSSSDIISKSYREYFYTDNDPDTANSKRIDALSKMSYPPSIGLADFLEGMGFPTISFNNVSCTGISFMEIMDKYSGETKGNYTKYNAFIIALGDDDKNIAVANALIDDILREKKSTKLQTIYVNVRSVEKAKRVRHAGSCPSDKLAVVVFGNQSNIYSMRDFSLNETTEANYDARYNHVYNVIDENKASEATGVFPEYSSKFLILLWRLFTIKLEAEAKKANEEKEKTEEEIKNEKKEFEEALKEKFKEIKEIIEREKTPRDVLAVVNNALAGLAVNKDKANEEWYKLDLFRRESNAAAARFQGVLEKMISNSEVLFDNVKGWEAVVLLSKIEHMRWVRFHLINGWLPGKKDTKKLTHDCIALSEYLPEAKIPYDIINVAMAAKSLEVKMTAEKAKKSRASESVARKEAAAGASPDAEAYGTDE